MKCPICFASQESILGELIHVCPYCDAILIPFKEGYRSIDQFPWWIRKDKDLNGKKGLIVTEKQILYFDFNKNWILNDKFILDKTLNINNDKEEKVLYIYGSLPIFTIPGQNISVIFDDELKIYHQKGLTIFKPV
ncbi:MAG: hypothetical protein ACP5SF_05540 [Thermoplasmata archaeon]